ncbi:oligosaccharide flippase family protein [Bdellovibrio sp. BCCA]|uniref:oligosaccharide flippase family protein n=1 Tax=Bdellovibrio sp. BCCA TaxID=3136281 RepID=UPI0030F15CC5
MFSQWAIYFTIVTIVGGISTARYSDSLVLIKTEKNARIMFMLCLLIGLAFSTLSVFLSPVLWSLGYLTGYGALLIPINVLVFCVHLSCLQMLVRHRKFSLYSISILTMSVLPSLFQFLAGQVLGATGTSIIIAGFSGQFISLSATVKYTGVHWQRVTLLRLKGIARAHSQFPKYSMGFAFFSLIRVRALYLIFGAYKDPSFLGYYAQTDRLLNAPSALLGASVRPVFFRYAAEVGIHNVEKPLRSIFKSILFCGAPIVGVLMFYSDEIITLILGKQWVSGAWLFKTMLIPSFLLLCTNWLDRAYDILKLQKIVFLMECFYGLAGILLGSYLILVLEDPKVAVFVLALLFSIYYSHWVLFLFKKMGVSTAPILIYIFSCIGFIFGSFSFLLLVQNAGGSAITGLSLLLLLSIVGLYLLLKKDWMSLLSLLRA